jgi:hypothetical protein
LEDCHESGKGTVLCREQFRIAIDCQLQEVRTVMKAERGQSSAGAFRIAIEESIAKVEDCQERGKGTVLYKEQFRIAIEESIARS